MKERLDVLLVKRNIGGFQRESKSIYYVRRCLCGRTERR